MTVPAPIEVAAWQSKTFTVSVEVPWNADSGTVDTMVVTATSGAGDVISATVEDTTTVTRVVGLELEGNEAKFGAPLEVVTYTHVLTNTGNHTDTYTIKTDSGPGWEVEAITPIEVSARQSETFVVSVTVPWDAISDTWDVMTVTATSDTDEGESETVQDTTTVTRVVNVDLEADERSYAEPLDEIVYMHVLTNTGNYTDTFDLEYKSNHQSWIKASSPVSVELEAWLTATVAVTLEVKPEVMSGTVDVLVITATSKMDGRVEDRVTDVTTVSQVIDVELVKDEAKFGKPGEVVTYSHTLKNSGNYTDSYTIEAVSGEDWETETPAPIELDPWQSTTFVVSVTVDGKAISDTWDVMTVTARSDTDGGKFATVQDTTTVTRVVGIGLEADESAYAEPLDVVTYTHVLTNAGNYTDTYTIEAVGSLTWTVKAPAPIEVGAWVSTTFVVSVEVPWNAISDTVHTLVVTATSGEDGVISATVRDTTTITRVVTLEFEADGAKVAEPLDVVIYSHVLTNTGNYTDTFDLVYWSSPDSDGL